tara:strand:+ start:253 stop:801 length:549 start_codon:yes stop_codon:yes gene_type:complete
MAKEIFSKDPEKFVVNLAEALKKIPEFSIPEWALFVKSGPSRERPPADLDFWHIRAASILRQLYIKGVVGVGKLRTRYGTRKDRGGKPDRFFKAGGKIIRVILQQAEEAGLVEKVNRLQHGRRLTEAGRNLLDSIEVEEKKSSFDPSNVIVNPVEIAAEETSEEIEETENDEVNSEDGGKGK